MLFRRLGGAALVIAALAGCAGNNVEPTVTGSTSTGTSTGTGSKPAKVARASGGVPAFDHVVVVVFENKAVPQVLDQAPYISSLAASGANFTNFFAETHP